MVLVDYLQLLRGVTYRGKNRVEEIGEISGGLKALAKELNLPVIAVSQLNRATEARDDKRPQLADLRASGDIEQDADVVMFVYRQAYYLERQPPDPADIAATEKWPAAQLGARIVAGAVGMSAFDLRRGLGVAERMAELLQEAQRWADVPFVFDQSGALTIAQLRNRVPTSSR